MEEIEAFRYRCRVSGTWGGGRGVRSSGTWVRPLLLNAGHEGGLGSLAVLTSGVHTQDAMRSVTKQAIREARLKEIKEELLHSERLKVRAGGGGTRPLWGTHVALSREHVGRSCSQEGLRRKSEPAVRPCPLQTYFEDNPRDLQLLRHDLPLHPAVVKPHLGHVPDYLGERVPLCGQGQGPHAAGTGRGRTQAQQHHPSRWLCSRASVEGGHGRR